MDAYFRQIKIIADSLAIFNDLLSDKEFVQYNPFGLNRDYESLVTVTTY